MADLASDTAVKADGEGRFLAELSPDWAIWGPNGGYLAGIALRAAAAQSSHPRPTSISCHFLSVADFGPVALEVQRLRGSRLAESLRVSMWQGDKQVLEALVWMSTPADGLAHDHAVAPQVDDPHGLPTIQELLGPDGMPPFAFWNNVDWRPVEWTGPITERPAAAPLTRNWYRYVPTATFDDPAVDAVRSLILLDTMSWPAARRAHPPGDIGFIAPTMDVNVQFHRAAPASDWLFVEGIAPVGEAGLIGFSSRVFSLERQLLASASGQMLCRPTTR